MRFVHPDGRPFDERGVRQAKRDVAIGDGAFRWCTRPDDAEAEIGTSFYACPSGGTNPVQRSESVANHAVPNGERSTAGCFTSRPRSATAR